MLPSHRMRRLTAGARETHELDAEAGLSGNPARVLELVGDEAVSHRLERLNGRNGAASLRWGPRLSLRSILLLSCRRPSRSNTKALNGNLSRNQQFESGSLQQRVWCEPAFLDQGAAVAGGRAATLPGIGTGPRRADPTGGPSDASTIQTLPSIF